MDDLDKKILGLLQIDNRISSEELGLKIGLSATACQRRLKKLRQSKVIRKEIAVLDGVKLDNYVTVIVEVTLKQGLLNSIDSFKNRMLEYPQVQQCFYVVGQIDFILVVTAKNMLAYEELTRELFFADDNIQKFRSTVSMENVKVGLDIPVF
ncbi:Lrp/AsnC family transcriptional regulator [Alginatibacterium sediminis]|uniref:Lrp/AsnC family transcriptional regulator n=1 Tax=Alginatibacterium sediminis TaxID=2164068 RepID=A0A420E6V4_9ALTE|nr:Lrp/AsnC family transcriptional regulator [Alginatibacterium sediminis]RKF13687.1 Lrp/AsnC family transcriptional regulator [Alginatibacterium sediminis]